MKKLIVLISFLMINNLKTAESENNPEIRQLQEQLHALQLEEQSLEKQMQKLSIKNDSENTKDIQEQIKKLRLKQNNIKRTIENITTNSSEREEKSKHTRNQQRNASMTGNQWYEKGLYAYKPSTVDIKDFVMYKDTTGNVFFGEEHNQPPKTPVKRTTTFGEIRDNPYRFLGQLSESSKKTVLEYAQKDLIFYRSRDADFIKKNKSTILKLETLCKLIQNGKIDNEDEISKQARKLDKLYCQTQVSEPYDDEDEISKQARKLDKLYYQTKGSEPYYNQNKLSEELKPLIAEEERLHKELDDLITDRNNKKDSNGKMLPQLPLITEREKQLNQLLSQNFNMQETIRNKPIYRITKEYNDKIKQIEKNQKEELKRSRYSST